MGGGPLPPKVLYYNEDLGHCDLKVLIDDFMMGQKAAFGQFLATLFNP